MLINQPLTNAQQLHTVFKTDATVALLFAEDAPYAAVKSKKDSRMAPSGLSPILAVDDSASIREMIATVLSAHGYRVVTAGDGKEALSILRAAAEPYVVLLDVVMPLLDGLAVVREIGSDAQLIGAGHKIILMSSTVRMSQTDIPSTVGQLAKPFTRQKLLETVEAAQHNP